MKIAYVASISVGEKRKTEEQDFGGFVSANNRVRTKKKKMGWERGRNETLADKPLKTAHMAFLIFWHFSIPTLLNYSLF